MFILDTLYEDFPTTYETQVNEFIVPIMIDIGILIVLFIVTLIALMKVFKKANRSGIAAYIPFYNLWVLLEIVNKPKIYIVLLLIPIINLIFYFQVIVALGKAFRKPSVFTLGMVFFPLIFIPILGFGGSEYIGINSEAMLGKSVAKELPVVEEKNEDSTGKPAQPLQERKKVEMSIGGGVYQKDYQKTLVNIEGKKKIQKPNLADFRVDTSAQQETTTNPQSNGIDLLADVQFIETNSQTSTVSETPEQTPEASPIENEQMPIGEQTPPTFSMADFGIPVIQQESVSPENQIDTPKVSSNTLSTTPLSTTDNQVSIDLPFIHPIEPISAEEKSISSADSTTTTPESIIQPTVTPSSNQLPIQSTNTQLGTEQGEYITCPHCGAKIKNGSPKCFMCGKPL